MKGKLEAIKIEEIGDWCVMQHFGHYLRYLV